MDSQKLSKTDFDYSFLPACFCLVAICQIQNPELKDPIYMDIQKQEQSTLSELKSQENALDQAKIDLSKVQPQTGQIKHAQRKIYEIEARVVKNQTNALISNLRKRAGIG